MKKYQGLNMIESSIAAVIQPIFSKRKDDFLITSNLAKNWHDIVGTKFSQFCAPKKVKFTDQNNSSGQQKNNGILYIKAFNPSIAFYLEANSASIIEKIACYYGFKIIKQIKISQELRNIDIGIKKLSEVTLEEKDEELIEGAISKTKDQELKSTLKRLGRDIFNKKLKNTNGRDYLGR